MLFLSPLEVTQGEDKDHKVGKLLSILARSDLSRQHVVCVLQCTSGVIVGTIFYDLALEDANAKFGVSFFSL